METRYTESPPVPDAKRIEVINKRIKVLIWIAFAILFVMICGAIWTFLSYLNTAENARQIQEMKTNIEVIKLKSEEDRKLANVYSSAAQGELKKVLGTLQGLGIESTLFRQYEKEVVRQQKQIQADYEKRIKEIEQQLPQGQ